MMQTGANRLSCIYSPYGHRVEKADTPGTGFTGQHRETGQGWYLLGNGHRVYNPALMRFHSPDQGKSPWGRGGINSYAYCQGDPVNFHDRSGRNKGIAASILESGLYSAFSTVTNFAAGTMPVWLFAAVMRMKKTYKIPFSKTDMNTLKTAAVGGTMYLVGEIASRTIAPDAGVILKDIGTTTANGAAIFGILVQSRDAAADYHIRLAKGELDPDNDPSPPSRQNNRPSYRPTGAILVKRTESIRLDDTSSEASDSPPPTPGLYRSIMGSLSSVFTSNPSSPRNLDDLQ
nr:RHS repeat-associated core domain-containing protein [Pseudomonas peradeniyensis]